MVTLIVGCAAAIVVLSLILAILSVPVMIILSLAPLGAGRGRRGAAGEGPHRKAHALGKFHARCGGLSPLRPYPLDFLSRI